MRDIIYLGSSSPARQQLLKYADIPFKVIPHRSDEQLAHAPNNFSDYVLAIAQAKMHSLALPKKIEVGTDYLFALTADSLIRNPRSGEIMGKPVDAEDANRMLAVALEGCVEVLTAVCLKKFFYQHGRIDGSLTREWTTSAMIEFYVDPSSVGKYLTLLPIALQCSGAGVIEGHGLSYLKSVHGSYTAAIGLPLYELKQNLRELGFALT